MKRVLFALLILAGTLSDVAAQDPMPLQRIEGTINLDGFADEAAWQSVDALPLQMYEPIPKGEMTERTEIRVGYDDDYMYVSGKLYDSDPENIRANTLYRDRWSGDDTFGIVLDTFNDNENALWFFVSPTGVRFDMAISRDANGHFGGSTFGGGAVNQSWNTYWDVETRRTEEGWFAEMRIPYSSLSFQEIDGKVEMGMTVYRFIARKGERHVYPWIPANWSLGYAKPSQARKVTMEGIQSKKPLYITPYVTGGSTGVNSLNDAGSAYQFDSELTRQAGLDLKYALNSNLTLDATVNTDFAQVEADDQQVNLSRFSLFFPEKRQFFQERSGLFEFSTGRRDRLFHSRQIGINDGETVRILGGGRLVGKIGAWDVGVINMQTESVGDSPSENFGVVRFRRQVVNDQSYAGILATSRLGDDGSNNFAYGADGSFKVGEDDYLDLKWAQTFEDDIIDESGFNFTDAAYASVNLQRRGDIGFSFRSGLSYSGSEYDPGIGFVQRNDVTQLSYDFQYGWLAPEEAKLRTHDGSHYGNVYFRNEDGSVESIRAGTSYDWDFKSSASARMSLNYIVEDLTDELSFPDDTTVPVGRHEFVEWQGNYSLPDGGLIRGRTELRAGSFYDGTRYGVQFSPTWNVSRFLELSGSYQYTRLEFNKRDQTANIHQVGIRSQIGLNTKLSLNSFLQYNTSSKLVASNVRFRYNVAEGNDLWIVYTENLNADRFRDTPALPVSNNRTVLLKYTYTFLE